MKLRNWFRSNRNKARCLRQAVLRARRRPLFESLESRSLLAAAVFNVTTTSDAGPGSLRQAIVDANTSANDGGPDVINFALTAGDSHHLYYRDDGVVGTLSPSNVATTSAVDDSNIGDIDPDYARSWWSIPVDSSLPEITDPVVINGYSQQGASVNTLGIGPNTPGHTNGDGTNAILRVELDGTNAFTATLESGPTNLASGIGLALGGGNCEVRGLVVNRFNGFGILVDSYLAPGYTYVPSKSTGNTIAGNFVGTDVSGTLALGNGAGDPVFNNTFNGGIVIASASNNTIGGLSPADRNLISGNGAEGLVIEDSYGAYGQGYTIHNNVVQGNLVGTDRTGASGLGNASDGIALLSSPSSDNTTTVIIGGTSPGSRNIISGNLGNRYLGQNGGAGSGIYTGASSGVQVAGNFIGTDVTGTASIGNHNLGIDVTFAYYSGEFVIGGTAQGSGNLISGNLGGGIGVGESLHVRVQGNFIGTNVTGTSGLPGQHVGIFLSNESNPDIVIGGTTAEARNIISGNTGPGIDIRKGETIVQGNWIGTEVTGTMALGNGMGIYLADIATGNQIGGTTAGESNLIMQSNGNGIALGGAGVHNNTIQGNSISVGANGVGIGVGSGASDNLIGGSAANAGNHIQGAIGLYFISSGAGNVIQGNSINALSNGYGIALLGSDHTVVGGSAVGEGNVIDGGYSGVVITGTADSVRGNVIVNSVAEPIGLGIGDGVDINDPLDTDTGFNDRQNHPVISTVFGGATTRITGALDSTASGTYAVDFYATTTAGQLQRYIGSATVMTDSTGHGNIDVTLLTSLGANETVVSTATNSGGGTSEVSGIAATVIHNSAPTANAGGPYTVVRGGTVTLDASGSSDPDQSNATLVYSWDLDGDGVFGETGAGAARGNEVGMNPVFSAVVLNNAGSRTVSLKVTDAGGLTSSTTSIVTTTLTGLIDDPLAPGKKMLVLGGSTGNDTIRISVEDDHHDCHDDDAQYVTIRINEHDEAHHKIRGTYALPVSRIVVYAQAGDDDVKMDDDSTIPAWLFGGDGDDRLKGGAGNDVLLGGAGADLISGSDGRDLMIGGTGADRIIGNAGDDILIAGTTDFDASDLALYMIMKEWTRTDSTFATRVNRLKTGGGLNSAYVLTDVTVHDDHAEDMLTGCEGNDWFLFNRDGDGGVKDKATDLATFEANYASDIDWLSH